MVGISLTADSDGAHKVAVISPDKLPQGGGVKVPTDPDGGGWRGRDVMLRDEDGGTRRILAVRTWLSE